MIGKYTSTRTNKIWLIRNIWFFWRCQVLRTLTSLYCL